MVTEFWLSERQWKASGVAVAAQVLGRAAGG